MASTANNLFKTMKFSKNHNNKLNCNIFTTIRPAEYNYRTGQKINIHETFSNRATDTGEIIMRLQYTWNDLPEFICLLDYGAPKSDLAKLFTKFYGVQFDSMVYDVLVIRRNV